METNSLNSLSQERLTPAQAYNIGDVIAYKVKSNYTSYCELIDEQTGITSYLQGTSKLVLSKGQIVKCRILAISEKHPKIELVDISDFEQNNDSLSEEKLTDLLSEREVSWNTKDFIKLLLTEEKEKSFEAQCHRWIQSLLNKKISLQTVRKDCSDLLELSELLNICSINERDFYQERLSLLIEQMAYYIFATELIRNEATEESVDTPSCFIDNLFEKLRVSGFVYQPNRKFNILSCLFLCKPDLMKHRIKELLDIICQKDIHIWEREPFCSALIKLLELYVRECDSKIDKIKDNRGIIDNNMLALAVQLKLMEKSGESGIADYRLNAARLCVLSSYLYSIRPEKFINAAYYNLFHSKAKFPAYSIQNVSTLPNYIFNLPCGNIDTINSFSRGNGRLLVSGEGIHLLAAAENDNLHPVFPTKLGLWKNLQVFLSSRTETSLSSIKANDITPYQYVWAEIEQELFDVKKKNVAIARNSKKRHRVDETVRITFTGQDEFDRNKYYCQIEDEIGGNGYIYVSDIVAYSVSTSLRHFYTADGSRLVFQAQIIGEEDELFHFSMVDDLKNYFSNDYYTFDEDIICSVGGKPNKYGMSPAITREGVSVSLRNASEFEGIDKNSIVVCRLNGAGTGTFHISCDIVDTYFYEFDLNTAFKRLMEECCVDKISKTITQQEEEQILKSDKLIDEAYVKEVIYMIDRMAQIDSEYVKSFNYLGFARVLCLLIGWESQAAYYKGRMDIIAMLHDFATNSKVDEEKLVQLENANAELFSNNVVLKEKFMQLQIVSFMDKAEHNASLFELANSNPSLNNLASLVLAYNITKANKLETCATDIHNKIITLLNLKGGETGLKLYGSGEETEEVEYKTSIVFCAESMQPDHEKQMDEILKVVDSFFNTRGGVLYIGVNNFGYGVGVEDDLNNPLFYGDKDKYIRAIVDAIAIKWGNDIATTYIKKIDFDRENTEKDVLAVEILPVPSGLPYNDMWYVRKAGSKRKLTAEQFAEYQRVSRIMVQPADEPLRIVPEEPAEQAQDAVSVSKPFISSKDDEVRTSRIRKNVLVDYEDPDNYVEPIALFKFLSGNKFKKIDSYDYDENSLLTLAVKDDEVKGYLVLGYENGHVVKIPVGELLEYTSREYSRNSESKLVYASLAQKDDAVLTISKEDKARPRVLMRADSLSNFEETRLMDGGELPYNEGLMGEILAYEVIPAKFVAEFEGVLNKPKTSLGYPDNALNSGIINRLHEWGIREI